MLLEKIHLESDERILTQVRKHWFILFSQMFSLGIAAVFPVLGIIFLSSLLPEETFLNSIELFSGGMLFFLAAWWLLLWMAMFSVWTNYYLDIWTVTNKRLIAVDQQQLFHRNTGSFRLERLQDMNVEIHGIIATLLDFGTLEAQTAGGSEEEFRASGLPHPRELKALILKASDDAMDGYRGDPGEI